MKRHAKGVWEIDTGPGRSVRPGMVCLPIPAGTRDPHCIGATKVFSKDQINA